LQILIFYAFVFFPFFDRNKDLIVINHGKKCVTKNKTPIEEFNG
jgi:hypothetical protein